MKNNSLLVRSFYLVNVAFLAATVLSSGLLVTSNSPALAQTETGKFTCGTSFNERLKKRVPTTIYWTSTDKKAIIQWTKQINQNWTPQRRCEEFSGRIQSIYAANPDRLFFTNSKMGGSNVICATDRVNGACKQLLMTLRSGDNPLAFLQEFKETFNANYTVGVIQHGSPEPPIYVEIDMTAILKTAPPTK